MIYKFNNFEVNQELREVTLSGVPQDVQPKVFDLLIFLIENRDRAVSKDDIQDALWNNLEVTETALTRSVMKVRKILATDTIDEPCIKTIHGHGYRFVSEVQELSHQDNSAQTRLVMTEKFKKPWTSILTFAVLISFIAVGFIFLNQKAFARNSSIAFLPFIDKTNNSEFAWTSIGLMGLSTEILKAQSNISTVSTQKTAQFNNISTEDGLNLSNELLATMKDKLQATHIVLSQLELNSDKLFTLKYAVFHPNGRQDTIIISGDNPTELSQQMTRNIIRSLPDSSINQQKYRVISEKPFTNELYARGVALRLEGKAKQARDYFKLTIAEDDQLFWPRYQYALTSRIIGLHDESIKELNQLKIELPELANNDIQLATSIENALGTAYLKKSEHKIAIDHYSNAYELAEKAENADYQAKISSNIAWIQKDQLNYSSARSWLVKSMQTREKAEQPKLINNIYLMGQLEFLMNDFSKSEKTLKQALQLYIDSNKKIETAKVYGMLANIYGKQGKWKLAHQTIDKAISIDIEIENDAEIQKRSLAKAWLYINQGRYSLAQELVNENLSKSIELKLSRHENLWMKLQFSLYYKQNDLQKALDTYAKFDAVKYLKPNQLSSTESIYIRIMYLLGNESHLEQWLKEYASIQKSGGVLNNDNVYSVVKMFVMEQNNDIQGLQTAYRDHFTLHHIKGFYAKAAEYLIKLIDLQIQSEDYPTAQISFNELQLFQLDWWQIDLLNAQLLHQSGDKTQSQELAELAKSKATESWTDVHEKTYLNLRVK